MGIDFALCLHFVLVAKVHPSSSEWPMRHLLFVMKLERAEYGCAYMRFLVFLGLAVVGTCKRIAIASASAGWPVLQLDCLRESRGQPFGLAACVQFEPFRAIANGAVVFC